jgi:PKD repeat protein
MFNDEWTFKRDGTMVYDAKGDYWAEGGIFKAGSDNTCGNTTDPMIGIDPTNENLSAWGGGTHHFRLDAAKKKVTAIGKGAFIGFLKASTDCEVMKLTPMVQDSVSYDVISLVDGTVDTLIVQVNYKFNPTDAAPGGYWRFVLVHYDNATDEPALPGFKPIPNFSMNKNGLAVAFESTTKYGTSYEWDFGDGATSTDKNPTHTYAADGFYTVSLKSTNQFGDASVSMLVTASTTNLTDAILQGGSWKVQVADLTVFVGPAMFSTSWWAVPVAGLNGSATGGDDWSCLPDDEFIFSSGGVFEYKTNGTARNDGYFGGDNGCITDAAIAESGNGAAFGSAVHSYIFNSGKKGVNAMPTITLSNGSGHAAFLGFYKGYYGGENTDKTKAPNGGNTTNIYEAQYVKIGAKEYLVVSTDISADHSRTKSWSAILER